MKARRKRTQLKGDPVAISSFKELRTCSAEPGGSIQLLSSKMNGREKKKISFWGQIRLGQELASRPPL